MKRHRDTTRSAGIPLGKIRTEEVQQLDDFCPQSLAVALMLNPAVASAEIAVGHPRPTILVRLVGDTHATLVRNDAGHWVDGNGNAALATVRSWSR